MPFDRFDRNLRAKASNDFAKFKGNNFSFVDRLPQTDRQTSMLKLVWNSIWIKNVYNLFSRYSFQLGAANPGSFNDGCKKPIAKREEIVCRTSYINTQYIVLKFSFLNSKFEIEN